MDSPRSKSKPSHYRPLPFHAIRTISFISASIVTGILIYFCYHLKNDGFKIPWTFLIVLAASIINLLVLLLTLFIHTCSRLSPLFNMILNIPILLLWIVGMSVLAYNVYGVLGHSCVISNFGNDRGVGVCQTYKVLFSFVVFGTLSQIAQVVLDIRARREQTRSGAYAKMHGSTSDLKLEPYGSGRDRSESASNQHLMPSHDAVADTSYNSSYAGSYTAYNPHSDHDIPGWRPRPVHSDSNHNYYSNRY